MSSAAEVRALAAEAIAIEVTVPRAAGVDE
jgi:hypothetical protein